MQTKHEHQMNQDCVEAMLIKASILTLKQNISFNYLDKVADVQVDISEAFMFSPNHEKMVWHSGDKKENLEQSLKALDKNKTYFLRTGTNSGAGHWQILYFEPAKKSWINYSTATNHYQLTNGDCLSTQGERLLSPHAKWGAERGQYSFLLVESSQANLIKASNFVYDVRTQGLDVAQEKLFGEYNDFYPELKAQFNSAKSQFSPSNKENQHPHNSPAAEYLQTQRIIFNELLNALKNKTDELITKSSRENPNQEEYVQYKEAEKAAKKLMRRLNKASDALFTHTEPPTADDIEDFQNQCILAISEAEIEFNKHRGWHAVHPILRGILGVLAALTIIPALLINKTTKHGYSGTFFSTPKTDAAEQLEIFATGLSALVNGIH